MNVGQMRNRRRTRVAPLIVAAALVLAACGSDGGADDPDPTDPGGTPTDAAPGNGDADDGPPIPDGLDADLVAAAQAEGEVVIYAPPPISAQVDQIAAMFTDTYGIDVVSDYAHPRDHTERILNEFRAGRNTADLVVTGVNTGVQLIGEGAIEPYQVAAIGQLAQELVIFPEMSPMYANVYGLLVNTEVISEVPTALQDLLSDAYAGQVAMDDPRVAGGGSTFFVATYDSPGLGRDFHEAFAEVADITSADPAELVAAGDYGVYVSGQPFDIARYEAAPLVWVAPTEGIVTVTLSLGIVANAPHPNAAKLFAEFLVTEEAQAILSEEVVPARTGIDIRNPLLDLGDAPFFPPIDPALDRNPYFELAEEIYGIR